MDWKELKSVQTCAVARRRYSSPICFAHFPDLSWLANRRCPEQDIVAMMSYLHELLAKSNILTHTNIQVLHIWCGMQWLSSRTVGISGQLFQSYHMSAFFGPWPMLLHLLHDVFRSDQFGGLEHLTLISELVHISFPACLADSQLTAGVVETWVLICFDEPVREVCQIFQLSQSVLTQGALYNKKCIWTWEVKMIFVQCVQASTHQIVVPGRHSRTACLERWLKVANKWKLHKHLLSMERHSKASSDSLAIHYTYWCIIIEFRLSLQGFGSWSFWGTMGAIISFRGGGLDSTNKSHALHSPWRLVPRFLISQSLETSYKQTHWKSRNMWEQKQNKRPAGKNSKARKFQAK